MKTCGETQFEVKKIQGYCGKYLIESQVGNNALHFGLVFASHVLVQHFGSGSHLLHLNLSVPKEVHGFRDLAVVTQQRGSHPRAMHPLEVALSGIQKIVL